MSGCSVAFFQSIVASGFLTSDRGRSEHLDIDTGTGYLTSDKAIATIEPPRTGRGALFCYLNQIITGAKTLIKVTNSNTTQNLAPDALAKVEIMGNNPVVSGSGATNFTINSSDVTCNFTGVLGLSASLYGIDDDSGLQFKALVYINEVVQGDFIISDTAQGNGVQASIPYSAFNVTLGDLISIRTIKNTFSGTVTIGAANSCYMILERL